MIPAFRVVVDGVDITDRARPRFVSLSISEKRGDEADQLDLVLDDADGRLAVPPTGARISVSIGLGDQLVDKGSFIADEPEWNGPPDTVTIKARGVALTGSLTTRRNHSWRETTLGAVISEIAGRNGLQPRVAEGLSGVTIALVAQANESDSALLRRLGREHDAVATVREGRLLFARIGSGQTASGQAIPAVAISKANGDRYGWRGADRESNQDSERRAPRGVRARWRNVAGAQLNTVLVGAAGNARMLPRTYATEASAQRAAQAEYDRRSRKKASFELTLAEGRPELFPEQRVSLSGFKDMVDQADWLIEQLTHDLSRGGLTTHLQLESV